MTIGTLCFFSPTAVNAADSKTTEPVVVEKKMNAEEVQAMIRRIDEIKAMDFKSMSSQQKKAVKQELKTMKHNLKVVEGVFIPVGTLIIIIILLLLL